MKVLAILISALLQIVAGAAHAQSAGTVRIIVPFGAGGPMDVLARAYAAALTTEIGSSIIVENKPGGTGSIAALALLREPPDGRTLLLGASSTLVTGNLIQDKKGQKLAYDPHKDLVPIGTIATIPMVLVSRKAPEFGTLRELVAYGQRNPGKLTYGSEGVGSTTPLGMELFLDAGQFKAVHVPYSAGIAAKMRALVAGEVDVGLSLFNGAYQFYKDGRVKIHAIAGPERLPAIPEVPTLSEAGYAGTDMTAWFTLFARAGTPPERIRFLVDGLRKSAARAELRDRLQGLGFMVQSPAEPAVEQKNYSEEFRDGHRS